LAPSGSETHQTNVDVKPGEGDSLRVKPKATSLESYRRLIELQKQMIELSREHEETKRECAALREQVARAITKRSRSRGRLQHRVQQTAGRLLKRLPGWGSLETKFGAFNNKPVSSC
jgi:seryl-tRNA synthetase